LHNCCSPLLTLWEGNVCGFADKDQTRAAFDSDDESVITGRASLLVINAQWSFDMRLKLARAARHRNRNSLVLSDLTS
jgi:hypothetical protein